jgi:hypothetical protein
MLRVERLFEPLPKECLSLVGSTEGEQDIDAHLFPFEWYPAVGLHRVDRGERLVRAPRLEQPTTDPRRHRRHFACPLVLLGDEAIHIAEYVRNLLERLPHAVLTMPLGDLIGIDPATARTPADDLPLVFRQLGQLFRAPRSDARLQMSQPGRPKLRGEDLDQLVELAMIVLTQRHECAIRQDARLSLGPDGERAKILGSGVRDGADPSAAVVTAAIERVGQREEPPKQRQGFGRIVLPHLFDNRTMLGGQILDQRPDLIPLDERSGLGDGRQTLGDLARQFRCSSGAGVLEAKPPSGGCVARADLDQQFGQTHCSQRFEILDVQRFQRCHRPKLAALFNDRQHGNDLRPADERREFVLGERERRGDREGRGAERISRRLVMPLTAERPSQELIDIVGALGGTWSGYVAMCPCPAHADSDPSLSLRQGHHDILVKCFAGCASEDVLRELRRIRLTRHYDPPPPSTASRTGNVQAIWEQGSDVRGTLAERYLWRRHLLPVPSDIRFHPRCPYLPKPSTVYLPALLVAVREIRTLVAIQRIFLDTASADYTRKVMLGRPLSGAWRGREGGSALAIAEGFEDAHAFSIIHDLPCWASLGAARLSHLVIPAAVTTLIIAEDNDREGREAAIVAEQHYVRPGLTIVRAAPPARIKDWAMVLAQA